MLVNSGSASGLLTVTKNCLSASDSADRERAGSAASGASGAACAMPADACLCVCGVVVDVLSTACAVGEGECWREEEEESGNRARSDKWQASSKEVHMQAARKCSSEHLFKPQQAHN